MDLSVVVPLYNEEESVPELYRAIKTAVDALGREYEIVFVDDGSIDGTFAVAKALAQTDPRLRLVRFRRNYGQTPAMVAGVEAARGRVIVTMDGDLQNDPQDIPCFLETIEHGYDVVVGWRHKRQDPLIRRKVPSRVANWLIGRVTGIAIKDNGCSLKAYRAKVIKKIPLYSEMHRFIPAMASLAGARVAEIKVRHHPRRFGVSKYGLSRIYKVAMDLMAIKAIISFAARPMLCFAVMAFPVLMLSVGMVVLALSTSSLQLAGIGIMSAALALFLLMGGAVGELVFKTGRVNLNELSELTAESVTMDMPAQTVTSAAPVGVEGI